jgi:Undecaprenyl-phosphate galactose phosphotransferase WbaP
MSAAGSKKVIPATSVAVARAAFPRMSSEAGAQSKWGIPHAGRSQTFEYLARAAADIIALCMAVALAGIASWVISTQILNEGYHAFGAANLQHRLGLWAILFLGLCSWFSVTGAYSARRPLQDDIKQVMSALTVMLMIDGFIQFAGKEDFSRLWIILVWPVAAVLIPVFRITARRLLNASGAWRMGAVVIGGGSHFASVAQSLEDDLYVGYSIACHLELSRVVEHSLPKIAAGLAADMQLRGAETAILVPSPAEMSEIDRVIDALNLNLIAYTLIPPLQHLPFAGLKVQTMLNSGAIMMTSRTGLMSPVRQGMKRIFDVVVSVLLIVMLLPILLIISGLVAWGGGPVLFGHKRIGKGNQAFRCLKFRTMAVNSDKILADLIASDPEIAREWRQNFKLENDPRITKVGRFLRKTSLDELPQLLNVIRGEMSLVGPRPVVADELRYYYGENAVYYQMVRPGITGLWQVNGRSQTTYERRVFLDTCYVRNWSLWTDVAILFNTVPSVLGGDGAR